MDPDPSQRGAIPFWRRAGWWKRTGAAALVTWAGTGLVFAATVVVARRLGPEDFGAVLLALAIVGVVFGVFDLTIQEGAVRFGVQEHESGRIAGLRSLLRCALLIDGAVGVVIAIAVVAAAGPLCELLGADLDSNLVRIAAVASLVITLDSTTIAVLLIAGRAELVSASNLVAGAMRLGLVLALGMVGMTSSRVLWVFAVAAAVGAGLQGWLAWSHGWKRWRDVPRTGAVWGWARGLLAFGLQTTLTTTLTSATKWVGPIVIGSLAGTRAVGIFGVGLLPLTLAFVASAPLRLMIYPEQVKLAVTQQVGTLRRSVVAYTKAALAVGMLAGAVGWFALPTIIATLYTSEFNGAVEVARIILIAAVAQLAYGWSKTFPAALGRPGIRTAVSAFEAVLGVGLLLLLVPDHGVIGAAWAVAASSLTTWVVWIFVARALVGPHVNRDGPHVPREGRFDAGLAGDDWPVPQ